jgi:hypothetical protein
MDMPETVKFESNGISCIAAVAFGTHYSLNMNACQINFKEKPKVHIEFFPHAARVQLNDGAVWFDTDEVSAAKIEQLFDSGKAPQNQSL